jgi:hypothetical protein
MAKTPKPRFVVLGKSKFVHVVHTELYDKKHSGCQQVRKMTVAGKVPAGGMSPEAASALDPCPNCDAAEVIASLMPVEDKRAAAKAKTKETLDKIRDESLTAAQRKAKQKKAAKSKPSKPTKAKSTEDKPKKASMTKSGPRSTVSGVEDAAKAKAELLAEFGEQHGWSSVLEKDKDTGHWVLTSKKAGQPGEIKTYFIDGKYDVGRHAEIVVGAWSGKLRGAHAVRRQMSMEGRDRPHPEPGKGRSGPRATKSKDVEEDVPEDESPEDARKRVPFLLDDDAAEVIEAIAGKTIRWRNGLTNGVIEARVPSKSKRTKIDVHPKTGKRMLDFIEVVEVDASGREVLGPERTVYLDKIVRVIG